MVTLAGLLTKFESPSDWVGNVQWMLVQDVENYIAARVVAHSRHLVLEKCRPSPLGAVVTLAAKRSSRKRALAKCNLSRKKIRALR